MVDVSSVWDCLPLAFSTPVNWQHRQQNSPAITKWWIASAIQRGFCPELNSGSSKKTAVIRAAQNSWPEASRHGLIHERDPFRFKYR